MQPGETIRIRRKKKGITQVKLAEVAGLTQGNISDIERGRQPASREFIKKIAPHIGLSPDDIVEIFGIEVAKESTDLWPGLISEKQRDIYQVKPPRVERRLRKNIKKRGHIDKVLAILDSGNDKVINALLSDIEVFFEIVRHL